MTAKPTIILGIESSCDDTSAAILVGNEIRANIIAGQAVHEKFGGVVPELASRAHQENIIPVVQTALQTAQISLSDLDAIAFTQGPGLMGSLTVGTSFAKAMGLALGIPLVGVHHMKAHILAHFIDDASDLKPSQQQALQAVHSEADRCQRLLNDLLNLSRNKPERLQLSLQNTDLQTVLVAVARKARPAKTAALVSPH